MNYALLKLMKLIIKIIIAIRENYSSARYNIGIKLKRRLNSRCVGTLAATVSGIVIPG